MHCWEVVMSVPNQSRLAVLHHLCFPIVFSDFMTRQVNKAYNFFRLPGSITHAAAIVSNAPPPDHTRPTQVLMLASEEVERQQAIWNREVAYLRSQMPHSSLT